MKIEKTQSCSHIIKQRLILKRLQILFKWNTYLNKHEITSKLALSLSFQVCNLWVAIKQRSSHKANWIYLFYLSNSIKYELVTNNLDQSVKKHDSIDVRSKIWLYSCRYYIHEDFIWIRMLLRIVPWTVFFIESCFSSIEFVSNWIIFWTESSETLRKNQWYDEV